MNRLLLLAALLLSASPVFADEIRVVSSGGFAVAYKELAPKFEAATGHTLVAEWGPSMGTTVDAVPQRLARKEPIDVVIMVGYALGKMVEQGAVAPADATELARSPIAMAVKAGAAQPDIGNVDGLRAALLAAKSVAVSDSASGVYIMETLFKKLWIEEQMKGRALVRFLSSPGAADAVVRSGLEPIPAKASIRG